MDFVRGLPASVETLDIPVDGFGRAELRNGRVRITYYREIVGPDGALLFIPTVSIVWSLPALVAAKPNLLKIVELLDRPDPEVWAPGLQGEPLELH